VLDDSLNHQQIDAGLFTGPGPDDLRDLLNVITKICLSLAEQHEPGTEAGDLTRVMALAAQRALRLVESDDDAAEPLSEIELDLLAEQPRDARKPTVLVVDDEPDMLSVMVMAFERAGFNTFSANNGWRALRMIGEIKPDLLVTDIIMPDVEGIQTIITAKRGVPEMSIIAVSGGGAYSRSGSLLNWARQLGADEALAKPFRMSALITAARVTLENRRNGGELERKGEGYTA
jgi:CheY-like chemotaxis protein